MAADIKLRGEENRTTTTPLYIPSKHGPAGNESSKYENNQQDELFFFCGAATKRGSWPPHS